MNVVVVNRAVPVPWPSRGRVDNYPWDYDPSRRFTRLKTGLDYWPQPSRSVSSPLGWLGSPQIFGRGLGITAFLPLIENAAFAISYMRGQVRPGPWTVGGTAINRAGGVPWQTSLNPIASMGIKSG